MYRIAVIQNEVEMQHSGYVDSVPKYRKQDFDLSAHVFNRFSSVNIVDLFIEGENYLLDYDCLIIGTNATSDGDVYNILCNEQNKKLLERYIELGKGVLICSQKKLKETSEIDGSEYKLRKTFFMPEPYEYKVVCRPQNESSEDGNVIIYKEKVNNIQKFICSFPHSINNKTIYEHCVKNDFQQHFYRDFIIPFNDSSYFPVLWDIRESPRNTLMVACPRKNEKIVISTMALDWAGHYELIENILYYLIIGIPIVAFVDKKNQSAQEFAFLMSEADLSKISYHLYESCEAVINSNLNCYHTLYVFSPSFSENEVSDFWEQHIKPKGSHIKLFYYKYIKGELVLVNFSYYSYVDAQKQEVETWLKSNYTNGLWGNSFWKTYDALFALYNMGDNISSYLKSTFLQIQKHYRNGSYDGVLAPTCGLLELESLILSNKNLAKTIPTIEKYFTETRQWLIDKYKVSSMYNKKFIIRSFYNSGHFEELTNSIANFQDELEIVACDGAVEDKLEVDLCLDIEVCLIYLKMLERKEIQLRVRECIKIILSTQLQNGRWDNNLGKTARLLVFLINHQITGDFERLKEDVDTAISRGIIALRNSYQGNNWENNVVTTSNAIMAIVLHDKAAAFKSKDFLNHINREAKLADSYNSLLLALDTIDLLTKKCGKGEVELKKLKGVQEKYEINVARLRTMTSIATVSLLLVLSYYLFLFFKDAELFKTMIFESFMWIPIVVGAAITGLIEYMPQITMRVKRKKNIRRKKYYD